jgi:hypothetical protein
MDFRLRHAYYDYKINDRSYKKNFEQFLREGRHGRPNPQPPSRSQQNGNRMPYDISWDDLVNNYMGEVVEGDINNVTELGLFVSLCGNYTGLVFWKNLQANYGEKFSKHQPIKVKINEAYIDRRTQKNKIDLRLVE